MLIDSAGAPEAIVIATGSEVGIAAEAVRAVAATGQEDSAGVHAEHQHLRRPGRGLQGKRAAGARSRGASRSKPAYAQTWWHYVGLKGEIVGIDHFGASAPAKDLFKAFGFTAEHVVEAIDRVLARSGA